MALIGPKQRLHLLCKRTDGRTGVVPPLTDTDCLALLNWQPFPPSGMICLK
jgi:hypothetical protein